MRKLDQLVMERAVAAGQRKTGVFAAASDVSDKLFCPAVNSLREF